MHDSIKYKAQTEKRVDRYSWGLVIGSKDGNPYSKWQTTVNIAGEEMPRSYSGVFNTTSMGCLGQIDTVGLDLSEEQQIAIRCLSYDRACKVAIKFKKAWWVDLGLPVGKGGVSSTDLPIRTIVYPSWVDGDKDQPVILISSYTWALDATRISSLIESHTDPVANAKLLELVLRDLAQVFENQISYDELSSLVIAHHAYSYSEDPNTAGAFALFGPGQFSNLYPYVQESANNNCFYMVGEAVSAHHAWIVGALISAYTQLNQFLYAWNRPDLAKKLKDSWFGGGEGEVPDGFVDKHAYWLAKARLSKTPEALNGEKAANLKRHKEAREAHFASAAA